MISPSPVDILTVSQLNGIIKFRLESDPRLSNCRVTGEISNFKHHSSGHMYFTLKDETARLRAIMFTSRNRNLAFAPRDGMRVVCVGSIGVFDRDGQYQLYVDDMQMDGVGALYAAFVQLRDRLEQEGLFAAASKKPLPKFPRTVGVVTSPTGAVIRDICSTLRRRYPLANIILAPAQVQGPDAALTIVRAIRQLVELSPRVDVLIVGRGGGSLEELWPFNEEMVARAIASCPIPVVSAVGHETDFTICDFVADVRAATPTAAAELVAPHVNDLRTYLVERESRATSALKTLWTRQKDRLDRSASSIVFADPVRFVDRLRQRIDFVEEQLKERVASPFRQHHRRVNALSERLLRYPLAGKLIRQRNKLDILALHGRQLLESQITQRRSSLSERRASLDALNPKAVLKRGYSFVTRHRDDQIVGSVAHVQPGDRVRIELHDGAVDATVHDEGGSEDGRSVQSTLDI